jgi:hypothetical protein
MQVHWLVKNPSQPWNDLATMLSHACTCLHTHAHTHVLASLCDCTWTRAQEGAKERVLYIIYIIYNYIIIVSFNMCRFAILHFVFVWASRQSFQRMTFLVAQGLDCKALLSLLLVPAQSLVVPQWTKGVTTGLVVLVWRLLIRRVGDHAEANVTLTWINETRPMLLFLIGFANWTHRWRTLQSGCV